MLIDIEETDKAFACFVVIDTWRIRFCSYAQAEAFVERLKERINALHLLPVSINRPLKELSEG